MANREFQDRVQRRTEREMDLYAVSPTKLRIGVPVSEGAFRLYREELKHCGLSRDTLMRQVLLWAADGGTDSSIWYLNVFDFFNRIRT